MQRRLTAQIERRRNATDETVHHLQVLTPAELVARFPEQYHQIALSSKGATDHGTSVLDYTDYANYRRRQDSTSVGLVVEAHIAAGDRDVERSTRRSHPFHRTRKLPHDFGFFRIAEVKTVGRADWESSRTRVVARGFGYRQLRPAIWIERDEAAVAIDRHRQRAWCSLDSNDGGAHPRHHQCVGPHHVVILAVYPAFACNRRRGEQTPERLPRRWRLAKQRN